MADTGKDEAPPCGCGSSTLGSTADADDGNGAPRPPLPPPSVPIPFPNKVGRSESTSSAGSASSYTTPAAIGFEVSSAWSVAGVGTCIQLRHRTFGLHIAMDMGTSAGEALGANHVFVSHSHIDHIGALLNHARARTLSNKPAKYYVPMSAVEPLLQAKEAYEALDGHAFQADIVGVQPGDVLRIHPNIKAVVFPTKHRVPSQGYALVREKSKGLKPEFRQLSSRDLGLLRKQGQEVTEMEDIVEVAYTGDTILDAVLEQPLVTQARLLIIECTYLEGDVVWAHKWHHVHIQEIVQHAATAFAQNERIVLCHVSRKYKLWDNVLKLVNTALAAAPALAAKSGVTLAGFGRLEPVTYLAEYAAEELLEEAEMAAATAEATLQEGAGGVGGEPAVGSPPGRFQVGSPMLVRGLSPMRAAAAVVAAGRWIGADGGLEGDLPEVRTKEEANRMLRVMSEDLGLRPRAESLAGETESTTRVGAAAAAEDEEEPSLQF